MGNQAGVAEIRRFQSVARLMQHMVSFQADKFELWQQLFLDLQMPVMDGLEAARQISRLAPNTAMLMFTMYNCKQILKEAQAVGIKDVLSKSEEVAVHLLASLNKICTATRSMPAVEFDPDLT